MKYQRRFRKGGTVSWRIWGKIDCVKMMCWTGERNSDPSLKATSWRRVHTAHFDTIDRRKKLFHINLNDNLKSLVWVTGNKNQLNYFLNFITKQLKMDGEGEKYTKFLQFCTIYIIHYTIKKNSLQEYLIFVIQYNYIENTMW